MRFALFLPFRFMVFFAHHSTFLLFKLIVVDSGDVFWQASVFNPDLLFWEKCKTILFHLMICLFTASNISYIDHIR